MACAGHTYSVMEHEEIRATVEAIGFGAAASHRTAAFLWGLVDNCTIIDVVVHHAHRPPARSGVRIHRTRHIAPEEITSRCGVKCVTPLRVLTDLGAVAPHLVSDALDAAAVSRLVTPAVAQSALTRASTRGRSGLGALRAAIEEWPLGDGLPDSKLEIEVARLLRTHRVAGFSFHPTIEGFEVDFAHLRHRLIIESDGFEFHSSRSSFESDRRRDAILSAAGWLVIRVTWRQVVEQPEEVANRIRSALAVRRSHRFRAS
jgi:very-short-patch-repair endonuclease